ncbi:MAG TPA: nicotinate (nicotinamide) nucleotide adenylyltransferase [Chitinophagales bacterium]|nr:nicotinate (nicotinamide) nucleotide adenylyltransferase [Chitinophagales bacterium]
MKIGLFFGSFNPIHNGHLIIANKMLEKIGFEEVWFIPSPLNPFKKSEDLLDFEFRYQMILSVIKNEKYLKVNPIENTLSKPSFTIDTIEALEKLYPDYEFEIIIGSDNLESLHLWKRYNDLLLKCPIHVYLRGSANTDNLPTLSNVYIHSLPLLDISSTSIRKSIKAGKSVIGEIDSQVAAFIHKNGWYL